MNDDDYTPEEPVMTVEQAEQKVEETGRTIYFTDARTGQSKTIYPDKESLDEDEIDTPGTGEHGEDDDEEPEFSEDSGELVKASPHPEEFPFDKVSTHKLYPPHDVDRPEAFHDLVRSMKTVGWLGRPLLGLDLGDHHQLLTGSHRYAAAKEAGISEIPVHSINGGDLKDGSEQVYSDDPRLHDGDTLHYHLKDWGFPLAAKLARLG
jgi:hypothetical protein